MDVADITASAAAVIAEVERAVDAVVQLAVEDLPDPALDDLLARIRRPLLQLEGVRSRAAAASMARAVSSSGSAPMGAVVNDHQRRLAEQHQTTISEMKQQIGAGRASRDNAATGRAMADGRVAPRHAQRIAQVLAAIPDHRRADVEVELLALAERLDATAFGRASRAVLGRERPPALARDDARQHGSRSFRGTDTEDGGFAFSGLLYGVAAETARVALNAFRRPDTPDEPRSPAQRGADAFEQLCASALRAGDAPTSHGVRPHVMIVFTAEEYAALRRDPTTAIARLGGSGHTVSGREVRNLLDDCDAFRVVLDAERAPIEVSTSVRTVPVGLWRGLLARDGGCVWEGCDAPASWCDVAHGNESFARDGKLSMDNALLLCRRHHRRFDHGSYRVEIHGNQVTIQRVSDAAAARDAGTDDHPPGEPPLSGEPPPAKPADPRQGGEPPPGVPAHPARGDEPRPWVSTELTLSGGPPPGVPADPARGDEPWPGKPAEPADDG